MKKEEIDYALENFPHVSLDVNDFADNLIQAYIHTLFAQVEKQHGIKEDFCTYNHEILQALAIAIAVILSGLEGSSDNGTDNLKDGLIEFINKYYIPEDETETV